MHCLTAENDLGVRGRRRGGLREVADVRGATELVVTSGKRGLYSRDLGGDTGRMSVATPFAMVAVALGIRIRIRLGGLATVELMHRPVGVRMALYDDVSRAFHAHEEHGNHD